MKTLNEYIDNTDNTYNILTELEKVKLHGYRSNIIELYINKYGNRMIDLANSIYYLSIENRYNCGFARYIHIENIKTVKLSSIGKSYNTTLFYRRHNLSHNLNLYSLA